MQRDPEAAARGGLVSRHSVGEGHRQLPFLQHAALHFLGPFLANAGDMRLPQGFTGGGGVGFGEGDLGEGSFGQGLPVGGLGLQRLFQGGERLGRGLRLGSLTPRQGTPRRLATGRHRQHQPRQQTLHFRSLSLNDRFIFERRRHLATTAASVAAPRYELAGWCGGRGPDQGTTISTTNSSVSVTTRTLRSRLPTFTT